MTIAYDEMKNFETRNCAFQFFTNDRKKAYEAFAEIREMFYEFKGFMAKYANTQKPGSHFRAITLVLHDDDNGFDEVLRFDVHCEGNSGWCFSTAFYSICNCYGFEEEKVHVS